MARDGRAGAGTCVRRHQPELGHQSVVGRCRRSGGGSFHHVRADGGAAGSGAAFGAEMARTAAASGDRLTRLSRCEDPRGGGWPDSQGPRRPHPFGRRRQRRRHGQRRDRSAARRHPPPAKPRLWRQPEDLLPAGSRDGGRRGRDASSGRPVRPGHHPQPVPRHRGRRRRHRSGLTVVGDRSSQGRHAVVEAAWQSLPDIDRESRAGFEAV